MVGIIRFFQTYEHVIYFILGLGGMIYGYRFYQAWQEVKDAIYGLEAETGKKRLNRAAISVFLVVLNIFVVFVIVTFIAPVLAPDIPEVLPLQPVEITATYLADPEAAETLAAIANVGATSTPFSTVDTNTDGCVAGEIEISSPGSGQTVKGSISITGTVSVINFGNYRIDFSSTQTGLWRTIQAGNQKVLDGNLVEVWDLSNIEPGEYALQLVVRDNEGTEFTPCRIVIRISND